MKLRSLKEKDCYFMFEWMNDKNVTSFMLKNFSEYTMEDCLQFIHEAENEKKAIHRAVTDENDTYMGTVSLRMLNMDVAEFSIVVRSVAMGNGYSYFAMKETLKYGFDILGLKRIVWFVNKKNKRAIRFYKKNKYCQVDDAKEVFELIKSERECIYDYSNYIWFEVERD